MASTSTQFSISLKGSAAIVSEYLDYAINSVLYQRGICPANQFNGVEKYGLTVLMSTNESTIRFLRDSLHQVQKWLERDELKELTLLILKGRTDEIVESWTFKVQNEPGDDDGGKIKKGNRLTSSKSMKRVQQEICQVMRQITSTVSFLPLLNFQCSYTVRVNFNPGCRPHVPNIWYNSLGSIRNAQVVQLKSFSTGLHKVDTVVNYQENDFI